MGSTYLCHVKSREARSEGAAPNCSIRMGAGGLAEPLMGWPMHKVAQCSNLRVPDKDTLSQASKIRAGEDRVRLTQPKG